MPVSWTCGQFRTHLVDCKSDFVRVARKNPECKVVGAVTLPKSHLHQLGQVNPGNSCNYVKIERKFELPQLKNDNSKIKNNRIYNDIAIYRRTKKRKLRQGGKEHCHGRNSIKIEKKYINFPSSLPQYP